MSGKTCARCATYKPLECFGVKARVKDGRKARCKACLVIETRAYTEQNKEAVAARVKRWVESNSEEVKAYGKAYYAAQRDRLAARAREWKASNPAMVLSNVAARKSRMRRPVLWADKFLIADIYAYARIIRSIGIDCHVDHMVPMNGKRVSGLHVEQNLTVLLAFDNLSKGASF